MVPAGVPVTLAPMRRRIRTGWFERAALRFGWARGRPPTDFELLRAIYERHDDDFAGSEDRRTRVYLPIAIPAIAKDLDDLNADMIAGRLHHDLDRRYADVGHTHLFQTQLGGEANVVNWPLLVGVLAGMWEERRRRYLTTGLSITSLVIAAAALAVSIVR